MRGVPTTAELVAAVRSFLTEEVMPGTEGRVSFHARVAANVLAQVERELQAGPVQITDDAELAAGIRDGSISFEQALPQVRASVVAKLRIANPRHLLPEDR